MYSLNFSSSLNPNLSNLYSFDLCEVSFQQRRNDSLYNYANFSVADAITKIQGLESTVKTLKAESADWMKKYENESSLRTEEMDVLKTQLKEMSGKVNEIPAKFLNSERSKADQLISKENVFTAASVSVKETEVVVKNTINKIDDGSAKSA